MANYKTFRTERLFLRPTTEEDAEFIFRLLNTPKWLQFIGDRNVHSVEEAQNYIRERMTPQLLRLGHTNFIVVRVEDEVKVGTCGLYDREGLEGIDIGFAFLPEYEGKGYAFEAATRLKEAAFEEFGMTEINAITTFENVASQRLLEKLGLKKIGTTVVAGDDEELLLYRVTNGSF